MAGQYLGGSTVIKVSGATLGVVEEPRRGERCGAAFPYVGQRTPPSGKVFRWLSRPVFLKFVRSVESTRAQPDLTEAQAILLDGFLHHARQLLAVRARKWHEKDGQKAAFLEQELRQLWKLTAPG